MASIQIVDAIGYRFRDTQLLQQALTHRSYGTVHNERIEFLGDGVLNCVIAEELFRNFPLMTEGELSRLRAALVNQHSLCGLVQRIGLSRHLRLGEGELKSGGAQRPSILADAVEALIGAVFLDGGYSAAHDVIITLFADRLRDSSPAVLGKDPKTMLQEFLQAQHLPLPQYAVIATLGKAHDQVFRVECVIPELNIRAEGEGISRRSAEQAAAQRAYELTSAPS